MLADTLKEDVPTFEEWASRQDFDYSRTESKIVDYVNAAVDQEKLDDTVSEASEIDGWEAFFEQCGIEKESRQAGAAREQIMAIIAYRRRLE